MTVTGDSGPPTGRRERLRAATISEIKEVARRHLVAEGPSAISLRAIAREMGMTAPALYRYFPSLDALVVSLCAGLSDELTETLLAARESVPAEQTMQRLYAMARAFRRWAIGHPAEFALMFGTPIPGAALDYTAEPTEAHEAAMRFGGVWAATFTELWAHSPFPAPAEADLDPRLRTELSALAERLGAGMPVGAIQVYLSMWIRLYGLVAMEVFGHCKWAVTDAEPLFEAELAAAEKVLTGG